MKKPLFLAVLFLASMPFVRLVSAEQPFSNPMLRKASEQLSASITRQSGTVVWSAETKNAVAQKKDRLLQILHTLDDALKSRDKIKVREQATLFRSVYKETLAFIRNASDPKGSVTSAGSTGSVSLTYYADGFEGMKTANGNPFSQYYFSAAACATPLNTLLQVSANGTSVIAKLNDRPNCTKYPNLVDLSKAAFSALGKPASEGSMTILGTVPKAYIKKTLPIDAFSSLGIALDSDIPNTYLKNETFHIAGKELAGKGYAILYLRSPSGKDITLGAKAGSDGRFEYDYPLEEIGTYEMVLSSGLGFKTSISLDITVLDDNLFSVKKRGTAVKDPARLDRLDVERVELPDFTSVYLFRFSDKDFHTLTIKSGSETFAYRGFRTIAIRSETLRSLGTETPVSVRVQSERSSTVFSHDTFTAPVTVFEKSMILVPGYKAEQHENISVTEKSGNITVRGTVSTVAKVRSDILVTLPDGNVEKYSFDSQDIGPDGYLKADHPFQKTIPARQTGLYLVEVNYDNGFAAYNGPVVHGDALPAYPNGYDGTPKEIGNIANAAVASESLAFVNGVRAKTGKTALVLDDTLNDLAAIKAKDMAEHRNISHTDSYGDKIVGTAKRNGIRIAGGLGENVA